MVTKEDIEKAMEYLLDQGPTYTMPEILARYVKFQTQELKEDIQNILDSKNELAKGYEEIIKGLKEEKKKLLERLSTGQ